MSIIPLFTRRARTWSDPDPTPPAGIPRPHTLRPRPDPEINRVVNMAAHRAIGATPWLTPEQRIAHLVAENEALRADNIALSRRLTAYFDERLRRAGLGEPDAS